MNTKQAQAKAKAAKQEPKLGFNLTETIATIDGLIQKVGPIVDGKTYFDTMVPTIMKQVLQNYSMKVAKNKRLQSLFTGKATTESFLQALGHVFIAKHSFDTVQMAFMCNTKDGEEAPKVMSRSEAYQAMYDFIHAHPDCEDESFKFKNALGYLCYEDWDSIYEHIPAGKMNKAAYSVVINFLYDRI